jgi:hypothetical protein
MKSTMQPRPSSDAIKERAHQFWKTQRAIEKVAAAIKEVGSHTRRHRATANHNHEH